MASSLPFSLAFGLTVVVLALSWWGLYGAHRAVVRVERLLLHPEPSAATTGVGTPDRAPGDRTPASLLAEERQRIRRIGVASGAGFGVLLVAWLAALAAVRRGVAALARAGDDARRRTAALEERIASRTRELRESEERAQAILDNTTAVIYVKDTEGRYLLINGRFEALFSVTKRGVIGRTDYDLFPHHMADAFRANDRQVLARGGPLEFDEVAPLEDGPHTYISIKFPLLDAAGRIYAVCGISTDITARQQAEDAARRRQAELAHVLRLTTVNEMAAALAHEISQPLTAIVGYAGGCLQRIEMPPTSVQDLAPAIEGIQTQALHARAVIARLREFMRGREPRRQRVDVNALVEDAARIADCEAREQGVVLRLGLASALPAVEADRVQLEQVVLNLVHNGIEAMAEHRDNGNDLVISTVRGADGTIQVSVRDGGRGVPPDRAQEMFEPFFTTKAHGLGMGLAISRSIIEAHGGRMWAVADPAGGTTVSFAIPTVPAQEAAA
jgi:PAS domain S-box-containing protein